MISPIDRWDGIGAHLDLDAIAPVQLLPVFPIKGDGGRGSGVIGHVAPQHHMVREDHGSETQHVGTDGGDQYARHGWMDDGPPRRHAVRSRSSGTTCSKFVLCLCCMRTHVVAWYICTKERRKRKDTIAFFFGRGWGGGGLRHGHRLVQCKHCTRILQFAQYVRSEDNAIRLDCR
jgi:hypothetical protein